MKVEIREDSVVLDGYVNAVERYSKPLLSKLGKFIERIMAGAFQRAIERNNDIKVLLNHDATRQLASTKEGTAKLYEDNIGLRARVKITDPEVIEDAKNNKLRGWSFGFSDIDVEEGKTDDGIATRYVKDLNLYEVSILNSKKIPAYYGTSVELRNNEETLVSYRNEEFLNVEVERSVTQEQTIDYKSFEDRLKKIKEEK